MRFVLPLALALALAAFAEQPAAAPSASGADAGTGADGGTPAEERKPERVRAVVHLKDGGLVRGTVRRMKLGKSITLTLQSGKSITFDDEDIVTIELLGSGAPADAGLAAGETPAAAAVTAPAAKPASAPAASPDAFPEQSVTAPVPKAGAKSAGAPDAARTAAPAAAPGARTPPLPELAPGSPLDTVYLNDGSLVRGTIETDKPDVVIRLVSGRKRTVLAREVKSIVRHGALAADATDAVWLKDGTVLRGAIESDKPDVVIKLVSGKKRTVPGASVQRIDRARKP